LWWEHRTIFAILVGAGKLTVDFQIPSKGKKQRAEPVRSGHPFHPLPALTGDTLQTGYIPTSGGVPEFQTAIHSRQPLPPNLMPIAKVRSMPRAPNAKALVCNC
jgi:hypothetical protein